MAKCMKKTIVPQKCVLFSVVVVIMKITSKKHQMIDTRQNIITNCNNCMASVVDLNEIWNLLLNQALTHYCSIYIEQFVKYFTNPPINNICDNLDS